MGRPAIDWKGKRIGRLLVLERLENIPKKHARWLCQCDCGKQVIEISSVLRSGDAKSCGCLLRDKHLTHGKTGNRLYAVWNSMKQRCFNSRSKEYRFYGARGINMCDSWHYDFEAFEKWALENGYQPEAERGTTTIDRIDVNGNYEPSNCRWITISEQQHNKRVKGGKKWS